MFNNRQRQSRSAGGRPPDTRADSGSHPDPDSHTDSDSGGHTDPDPDSSTYTDDNSHASISSRLAQQRSSVLGRFVRSG